MIRTLRPQKGGVGTTTLPLHRAAGLALAGHRVLRVAEILEEG